MRGFELVRPATLEEAIRLLDTDDPTVRPLSGGTAIMQMMKTGIFKPSRLVCLSSLAGNHSTITVDDMGCLCIGAMTTLGAIEHSQVVLQHAPLLPRVMKRLANVRVRNVATVGGALAHGDPHMDLPPVLAALDAEVIAQGPGGQRRIPVAKLYAGYFETILQRGEIIASVSVPPQAGRNSTYRKTTTRTADDWPALGVAASVGLGEGVLQHVRLFASAATERMTRLERAEAHLRGKQPRAELLEEAGRIAAEEVEVIEDAHGSATYKVALVAVQVRRALHEALHQGSEQ
ncbi:MAG: xanthine dehydrogenase family protein subunit M [Pseudaminobacter sp.]